MVYDVCRAVLCRAVLCCAVLCCAVLQTKRGGGHYMAYIRKRKPSSSSSLSPSPGDIAADSDASAGLGKDDRAGVASRDEWLWFSDLCCGEVSSQEVAAAEPYICFYERV